MFLARKNTGYHRVIVWLLVISSLACWEIAASRFQGCSLGNPDLRSCQPIDFYSMEEAGHALLQQQKGDGYQSAQLLALTSQRIVINPSRSAYSTLDTTPARLRHSDAPPTPPPDISAYKLFA